MLKIDICNNIIIDGRVTGLKFTQRKAGSVIYTPEGFGRASVKHKIKMPYTRYSATHDAPSKVGQAYDPNVTAGCEQLEADVRALLVTLNVDINKLPLAIY